MAKKGNRTWIKVVNKATGSTYLTARNKVNEAGKKVVVKKYDSKLRKHVEHTEVK